MIITGFVGYFTIMFKARRNCVKLENEVAFLNVEGMTFKDLDKNGKHDIYGDSKEDIEARINDLVVK